MLAAAIRPRKHRFSPFAGDPTHHSDEEPPLAAALSILCAAIYLGGLLLAAGWDMATRSIPNSLVAVIAAAAALWLLLGAPATLPAHALVALAVLVGGIVLFALRLWGAGDAKLLAATAIVLGAKGLPLLILGTAAAGGILAILCIAVRFLPWRRKNPADGIPYGVAIACGAIIALAGTDALGPLSGL
jgi:prepilin peptidase CpaA